jgi:hypothetical protein
MAKEHAGGIILATGFRVDNPSPLDDRLVVGTLGDLTSSATFPNIYPGILVAVSESNYDLFKWNGEDRTNYDNWSAFSGGAVSDSGGDADSANSALSASFASSSISSSFATTSSLAFSSLTSISSSYATTSSHALNTFTSTTSSFALTASHVLNLDIGSLQGFTQSFNGNRNISTAQIPGLFGINPYINAYDYHHPDSSSITDFLEAVFYPPIPNLPPKIISNNQVSIPEFRPSSSFVFDIIAEDQMVLNDPSTMDFVTVYRTQSNYTDDFFRIDDPSQPKITLNTLATTSMNAPGGQHLSGDSHQFEYEVGDSRGAFTQEILYIRIIPDDKPVFTTDNDPETGLLATINEHEISSTFITTIEGTDEENGVTFRTSSNNTDGFFNISSSNGQINLTTKSTSSMNTDIIHDAYPLDIEVVDQFGQSTLKTFYIRIKPNTAPIFKLGSPSGNTLEGEHGLTLYSVNSQPGLKRTIFAVNSTTLPLENDNIEITTGSNSSILDNDFEIIFNNTEETYGLPTQAPSIEIKQTSQNLNPNLNSTYQLILTASDHHYKEGDDEDSVSFLTVNINVTANADPQLQEQTQSFYINENSNGGDNVGTVNAIDPDADNSLVPEQPFIDSLQLKGAFFRDGGFPPFSVNTDDNLPNLTESYGGTGIFDPTINPFEKISNLGIRRKNNVFLNSDKINLYEYIVNIGGNTTAGGGAIADTGILQIKINDHVPNVTFLNNFNTNPFIIESAEAEAFFKVNENGFNGIDAKIYNSSQISYNYEISSSYLPLPIWKREFLLLQILIAIFILLMGHYRVITL